MLTKIFSPFIFLIGATLYVLNMIFWGTSILILGIGLIVPNKKIRDSIHRFLHHLPFYWMTGNYLITCATTRIDWEIHGTENLSKNGWYLVISNHQSWIDIFVLVEVFRKKIPLLKFFMKRSLLWQLPIASQVCWLLDYPFVYRHSKSYLQAHPEKKGKDIAITQKSCEKFRNMPTTIVNFVEGHRFSVKRYERQNSPYQHLLKPRAGGVGFVLSTMGDILHTILDVTIVYPPNQGTLYNYLSGRLRKIVVYIEAIPITPDLIGNYETDKEFRVNFQKWLNKLWEKKDKLIQETLERL